MERINTADGLFHEGNPATGEKGTKVTADWLNALQEEVIGMSGGWLSAHAYSTLAEADAAAVAANKLLVISTQFDVVPSVLNADIKMLPGGKLNNSGACTIASAFSAGLYPVFIGEGPIVFGSGSVVSVPSVWFGEDGSSIQKALDAVQMVAAGAELSGQFGATVRVPSGRFLVSSTLSVPTNVNLCGEGTVSTILQADGLSSGEAVVKFEGASGGQTHSKLSNLTVSGATCRVIGLNFWDGSGSTQQNFCEVESIYFTRCNISVNVDSSSAAKYIIYGKISNCTFECPTAYTAAIRLKNSINWLRIEGNHFFGTSTTGRAILSDATTNPDSVIISNNSIDCVGNAADDASLYLMASAGTQSSGYIVKNNRIEGGGVYVAGTWTTASISDNFILDAAYCVKSVGIGVRIAKNTLYVKNAPSTTKNSTAIIIVSGATDNVLGDNNWGQPVQFSYAPIRYSDAGTRTLINFIAANGIGSTGSYQVGDIARVGAVTLGRADAYRCVVAGSINSSAAATTGSIASGSYNLTLADATGYERGMVITIAGVSGSKIVQYRNGNVVTLTSASDATVSAAAVALQPPTWRATSWTVKKGTTAERPPLNSSEVGVEYFDTTLDPDGLPIRWTGTTWIKSDGSYA